MSEDFNIYSAEEAAYEAGADQEALKDTIETFMEMWEELQQDMRDYPRVLTTYWVKIMDAKKKRYFPEGV